MRQRETIEVYLNSVRLEFSRARDIGQTVGMTLYSDVITLIPAKLLLIDSLVIYYFPFSY